MSDVVSRNPSRDVQVTREGVRLEGVPEDPHDVDSRSARCRRGRPGGSSRAGIVRPVWASPEVGVPAGKLEVVDQIGRVPFRIAVEGQLGVGLHDVPALEEGLLGHLPVGLQPDPFPPADLHVPDKQRVQQRRNGAELLSQRPGVTVQVDEHAPPQVSTRHSCRASSPSVTQLGPEALCPVHQRRRPVDVPAPAVERAHDLTTPERPRPHRQLGGPMRAHIVKRLDVVWLPGRGAPPSPTGRRSCTPRSRPPPGSPRAGTPSATRAATAAPARRRKTRGPDTAASGSSRNPRSGTTTLTRPEPPAPTNRSRNIPLSHGERAGSDPQTAHTNPPGLYTCTIQAVRSKWYNRVDASGASGGGVGATSRAAPASMSGRFSVQNLLLQRRPKPGRRLGFHLLPKVPAPSSVMVAVESWRRV